MDNIYFNNIVKKKVMVSPKFMGTINNYLENYLKKNYEGRCIAEGYVKPETIKIVRRSVGAITGSRFTGDITYLVEYSAEICNPSVGNVIECTVKNINKLGLLCNNGPITVIIGKKFHDNMDEINKIKEGDKIKVEVIAKKIQLNKTEIQVVGKLYNGTVTKKPITKKVMVNSDIDALNDIDKQTIGQNMENIKYRDENDIREEDEEDEEEEDGEFEEVDEDTIGYDSDEDLSQAETMPDDENMDFGDIDIGEDGEMINEDVEEMEDEDDEENDEEEDSEEYDYT
jgi:DNA-directed RNA polymerase subunit E'/Rpb7